MGSKELRVLISEETYNKILEIKKRNNLGSMRETIEFLVGQYEVLSKIKFAFAIAVYKDIAEALSRVVEKYRV